MGPFWSEFQVLAIVAWGWVSFSKSLSLFRFLLSALPSQLSYVKNILLTTGNNDVQNARNVIRLHGKKMNGRTDSILRLQKGRRQKGSQTPDKCSYCKISGHLRADCRSRKFDEKLGYFFPNRDAPWRANMEEAIKRWIEEAVKEDRTKRNGHKPSNNGKYDNKSGKVNVTQEDEEETDDSFAFDDEQDIEPLDQENLNCIAASYCDEGFSMHLINEQITGTLLSIISIVGLSILVPLVISQEIFHF